MIPENSICLIDNSDTKFFIYARDFDESKPVRQEFNMVGGFPIPNFVLVFECRRSLITRDGRIYVTKQAFDYQRRDYFEDLVPKILKDCRRIFEEGLTPEEVLGE